jgi:hypothetical protein
MSNDHLSPDLRAFIATLERNEGIPFSVEGGADEDDGMVTVQIDGTDIEMEIKSDLWDAAREIASARGQTMDEFMTPIIVEAMRRAKADCRP